MRVHASIRRRRPRAQRAFTLIELAIVVCIVGVLAVLGILGYQRYRATARMSEATTMTSAIRAAQQAYKVEHGVFAEVSVNQASLYPTAAPGKFVTQWGKDCNNCKNGDPNGWRKLAVEPHEPVMYGYATVAGIGGASLTSEPPPMGAQTNGFTPPSDEPELKATDPYFVTVAWGDTDGNGKPCIVLSYSTSNQLVIQAAGE
jgi:type IV pilus assembly protein PilA